jgi:hypothetical protein
MFGVIWFWFGLGPNPNIMSKFRFGAKDAEHEPNRTVASLNRSTREFGA